MGLAPVASQLVRQAGWPIWLADWPTSQSGWLLSLVAGWLANQAACLANEPASQQPRCQPVGQPASWPASVAANTPSIQEAGQHAMLRMPTLWSCKPHLRHLEPRPESQQIEFPGTGFAVFWSQ